MLRKLVCRAFEVRFSSTRSQGKIHLLAVSYWALTSLGLLFVKLSRSITFNFFFYIKKCLQWRVFLFTLSRIICKGKEEASKIFVSSVVINLSFDFFSPCSWFKVDPLCLFSQVQLPIVGMAFSKPSTIKKTGHLFYFHLSFWLLFVFLSYFFWSSSKERDDKLLEELIFSHIEVSFLNHMAISFLVAKICD